MRKYRPLALDGGNGDSVLAGGAVLLSTAQHASAGVDVLGVVMA